MHNIALSGQTAPVCMNVDLDFRDSRAVVFPIQRAYNKKSCRMYKNNGVCICAILLAFFACSVPGFSNGNLNTLKGNARLFGKVVLHVNTRLLLRRTIL